MSLSHNWGMYRGRGKDRKIGAAGGCLDWVSGRGDMSLLDRAPYLEREGGTSVSFWGGISLLRGRRGAAVRRL